MNAHEALDLIAAQQQATTPERPLDPDALGKLIREGAAKLESMENPTPVGFFALAAALSRDDKRQ